MSTRLLDVAETALSAIRAAATGDSSETEDFVRGVNDMFRRDRGTVPLRRARRPARGEFLPFMRNGIFHVIPNGVFVYCLHSDIRLTPTRK